MSDFLLERPRRLRRSAALRSMLSENHVSPNDLIAPLFVIDGKQQKVEIKSMPGQFRFSQDLLIEECKQLFSLGIKSVALFPAIEAKFKTPQALEAINPEGLYQQSIRSIKESLPDMLVMTDVALDPYNSDGHDGLVDSNTGEILNDETLELLCQMAVVQAQAGADIIGPSDMMDGRIGAIRRILDTHSFHDRLILSYAAKYDSNFYGPYREAVGTGTRLKSNNPKELTDKKTYQLSTSNSEEALREAAQDITEGADILMVKPALPYLDIIQRYSKEYPAVPVFGFQVTGEYALFKHYPDYEQGQKMLVESLLSMKRAGAKAMLTYGAIEVAELLNNGEGYSQ